MARPEEGPAIVPAARLRRRAAVTATGAAIDAAGLAAALSRAVEGEVRFDGGARALYATDASNYRHVPIGVCVPRTVADVQAIIDTCRRFGAPIVSRAGGTALAGQTCNAAVVIDFSRHLNRILALDPDRRVATVEPGVICDQLADAAAPFGLTYGPKPATHDHCCYGGMLGNNSCGIHAQMAGKAVDNTEAMTVLLYDGTVLRVGWMDDRELVAAGDRPGREGAIYRGLRALRDRYGAEIRRRFPAIPRRVSGYNLDSLLPGPDGRVNVARALVGSEGTLVTMLDMTVRLVPDPPSRALVVIGYPDVFEAADHVPQILEAGPIGLEAVDRRLRENIEQKGGPHERFLHLLPDGHAWLFVELGADDDGEARAAAERLCASLPVGERCKIVTDPEEQAHLWAVRESGLGATAFVPGHPDAWPGFEDSAVAPERLGAYLRDLRALFERFGYDPSVYGHFGMGCVHCRIDFELGSTAGVARFRRFMEEAADLVAAHGGSLSGEHGDGQARAELLPRMFGPEIVRAFAELKLLFDPADRMNPGRVVAPRALDADLRNGPASLPWRPQTYFRYAEDGGSFAHATRRCVGIGKCRRLHGESHGDDTMCPSFMVTREEQHSTRGRTHLLFEMLEGGPVEGGWEDEAVKEALDLCLACKGCKGDCPVNVDMATYKAEFLAHHYETRRRPRSAYAFGLIDRWARLASLAPGLANLATRTPGLRAVARWIAGVAPERTIPAFAPETFRRWFRRRRAAPRPGAPEVVLWPDTFNDHFMPETAQAAVRVLEDAGFGVLIPDGHLCCGRPLYDYGFLDLARRTLEKVLAGLAPHLAAGRPLVVLEPSCASVFRDELTNLLPERDDARRLRESTFLLSELLEGEHGRAVGWRPPSLPRRALVQAHCHHKAVMRLDAHDRVLERIGLEVEAPKTGCCGMAGAFGFERGLHHEVSVAAGERVLLPAVRQADATTLIVADGFSCREQIAQGTSREALHLAEVLDLARTGRAPLERPERAVTRGRHRGRRRSMLRAALALAGAALGLAGAWAALGSARA